MNMTNWHAGGAYALPPKRKNKLVRGRSMQNKAADAEQQLVAVNHGDGEQVLSEAQADDVLLHSERLKALDQARTACRSLGDAVGASLGQTVESVIKSETKRFLKRTRGDPNVANEMRKALAAEEANYKRKRQEFKEHMQAVQDKKLAQKELKAVQEQVKKAKKDNRFALEVMQSAEFAKTYTLVELGQGKKKAGGEQYRKSRGDVLERLRRAADLSPTQTSDWTFFKTHWDRVMAETHEEDWAKLFAETIQQVHNELDKGNRRALSTFMYNETQRVLKNVPVLQIRGTSVRTQP